MYSIRSCTPPALPMMLQNSLTLMATSLAKPHVNAVFPPVYFCLLFSFLPCQLAQMMQMLLHFSHVIFDHTFLAEWLTEKEDHLNEAIRSTNTFRRSIGQSAPCMADRPFSSSEGHRVKWNMSHQPYNLSTLSFWMDRLANFVALPMEYNEYHWVSSLHGSTWLITASHGFMISCPVVACAFKCSTAFIIFT